MAVDTYILAVDHGTTGIKTSIVSSVGKVMVTESEMTPMRYLPGGGAEQDPGAWWNALVSTARRAVGRGVVPARSIEAVCVSSTFSSTVAVDEKGSPLMNSLTWMDSRGAPYVRRLMGGFPSVQGYNVFNLWRWIPRTGGGPTLSGKDDIAHVLFIQHEFPEIYDRTYMFLPSKDYLNLRLTGKFAASFDSIQLFWVTNTRDITRIIYDTDLIRRLGIEKTKLPPLKNSIDVLGTITPEAARETGLGPDVKVVMGSADHQAALVGSGAVRDYEGHLYIGTSSWVQCIVPFKRTDVLHSIASLPSAIPGRYQSVNEQDIAGGALTFLSRNVFRGGTPPSASGGHDPYRELDEIALHVPPGSNNLIFTPWLNGERTPVDDNTLRGGLYNISKTTTRDDIVRAVFEGVAFNTRWSLKYVEKFVGRTLTPLNIVGGGAKSDVWCQIFADVLGRDIRQVEDPWQANARGAAFIASVGLGHIAFNDIPRLIRYRNVFHPRPEHGKTYDVLFREFVRIYRKNRAMFRRLNS